MKALTTTFARADSLNSREEAVIDRYGDRCGKWSEL